MPPQPSPLRFLVSRVGRCHSIPNDLLRRSQTREDILARTRLVHSGNNSLRQLIFVRLLMTRQLIGTSLCPEKGAMSLETIAEEDPCVASQQHKPPILEQEKCLKQQAVDALRHQKHAAPGTSGAPECHERGQHVLLSTGNGVYSEAKQSGWWISQQMN